MTSHLTTVFINVLCHNLLLFKQEGSITQYTCTLLKKQNNGTSLANELKFNDCHGNVFFRNIQ